MLNGAEQNAVVQVHRRVESLMRFLQAPSWTCQFKAKDGIGTAELFQFKPGRRREVDTFDKFASFLTNKQKYATNLSTHLAVKAVHYVQQPLEVV